MKRSILILLFVIWSLLVFLISIKLGLAWLGILVLFSSYVTYKERRRKDDVFGGRGKSNFDEFLSRLDEKEISTNVVTFLYLEMDRVIGGFQFYPDDKIERIFQFGIDDVIDILVGFDKHFNLPKNADFDIGTNKLVTVLDVLIYADALREKYSR
ncbi:MAG: hypothetical protein IPO40_23575 [Fibrobacteres bacterium]|nr:hypothetical protein [Fibrobacterota bacterium]